jgi:hypothetical protein
MARLVSLSSFAFLLVSLPLALQAGGCDGELSGSGGDDAAGGAGASSTANASTTASASTTAGATSTTTSTETGGAPPGTIPVFVAQGHMGRLMVSCDDGHTFVANQSADDNVQCWGDNNAPDCDHSEWAGRGLAFGNGVFVSTFGWGYPGVVRRSTDGVTWLDTWSEPPTFADIAFGNGKFVANGSPTSISTDGMTWEEGGDLTIDINYRAIEFVPHEGGLFIVTGESGENRDIVLSDDGVTWRHPTTRPPECGSYVLNIAYGGGTIAIFSGNGSVCSSTDGGDTWTLNEVNDYLTSPGVWTGSEFFVYGASTLFRSSDANAWQSQEIAPSVRIGSMARSDQGTFVAHEDSWLGWYEDQEMYRSENGIDWEVLPAGSFVPSHPINFIQFGYAEPSSLCPLP